MRSFISLSILAFYLCFVVTITIVSRNQSLNAQFNYILFWSYKAIASGNISLIAQVFWNVVLFIPMGILLMLILTHKNKWIITISIGIIISMTIELIQLISHRGLFEFDDIIHNSLGTIIGVGIYLFFSKAYKYLLSRIRHK